MLALVNSDHLSCYSLWVLGQSSLKISRMLTFCSLCKGGPFARIPSYLVPDMRCGKIEFKKHFKSDGPIPKAPILDVETKNIRELFEQSRADAEQESQRAQKRQQDILNAKKALRESQAIAQQKGQSISASTVSSTILKEHTHDTLQTSLRKLMKAILQRQFAEKFNMPIDENIELFVDIVLPTVVEKIRAINTESTDSLTRGALAGRTGAKAVSEYYYIADDKHVKPIYDHIVAILTGRVPITSGCVSRPINSFDQRELDSLANNDEW